MGRPVVHFDIIGTDPAKLRSYYGELFGWEFNTSSPVAQAVSEPQDYGFVDGIAGQQRHRESRRDRRGLGL